MKEYTDLGKVTVKHVSGMAETDKEHKFPCAAGIDKGDQLIEQNGRKMFMKKEDWDELNSSLESTPPEFKKGVTKAMIKQAAALGIAVSAETTKEELQGAIDSAELAELRKEAVLLGIEGVESMSKTELIIVIGGEK